jgi:predicted permease
MKRDSFAVLREALMRLAGTFRRSRSDADMQDELAHHLELAENELRRRGHSPEEACRLARVRVGSETQAMETARQQSSVPTLSSFGLDARLGLRMLRKHWGLTLAGGLSIAAAIGIGAAVFDVIHTLTGTQLPLNDGDRIVVIQPWDPATRKEQYSSREDFLRWREQLQSMASVAAFATVERNLITEDGRSVPTIAAQMTAAGFRIAGVEPLLGRFLLEEDEGQDAAPVVILGHTVWQSRFGGDSAVLGRTVQFGDEFYTVAGVMPEDFIFPVSHDLWVPLHAGGALSRQALAEPVWGDAGGEFALTVFGRLASGVSLERANVEAAAKGLTARAVTGSGPELEPRVVPYTIGITGNTDGWLPHALGYALALLLIPPCANIAVLIYARIVTREQEFAARLALGASRGRIVSQIFTEVLVLAAVAAGVGLALASKATALFQSGQEQRMGRALPFWMDFHLSPRTMLYAFGLALVAALIAGAIPAIRATGSWNRRGLHALGNRTSLRLGKVWTGAVVLQVALSVATLPAIVEAAWWTIRSGLPGDGFDPGEYLTARLVMDRDTETPSSDGRTPAQRFAAIRGELIRELEADPSVTGVSVSQALPGVEPLVFLEHVDNTVASEGAGEWVRLNQADQAFFEIYQMPLLVGRWLEPADLAPGNTAVLVNRSYAEHFSPGQTPLGKQIRPAGRGSDLATAWEVAGVVDDEFDGRNQMTMYRLLPPVPDAQVLSLNVRVAARGSSMGMASLSARLREIAARLDPSMRIVQPRSLAAIYEDRRAQDYLGTSVMIGVVLGVVLFSMAGIYTILSFTVEQRRRDIGIRAALGAPPMRLVASIFMRAMLPVGVGVLVGGLGALGIEYYLSDVLFATIRQDHRPWILPAAEAFMLVLGAIALAGPARRALQVDPVEALRES